jgi:hypothetical protein
MKESTIEAIRYFMPGVIALISAGVITLTGWGVYEGCSSLYNTYEQYENRRTEWSKKHPSIEEYIDLNHDGIPDRMITTYDIDSLGDRHFFSRDITYCFRDTDKTKIWRDTCDSRRMAQKRKRFNKIQVNRRQLG